VPIWLAQEWLRDARVLWRDRAGAGQSVSGDNVSLAEGMKGLGIAPPDDLKVTPVLNADGT